MKVVVAMSGGVDSSVAAALLKEAGHDVIGVTMQLWPRAEEKDKSHGSEGCCGLEAIEDARKVAYKLGIPHYVVNFRDIFARKVIADFCQEYRRGRTPNPCIRCNQYIKFGALLERAREMGADFIATGHHARIERDKATGTYLLKKGADSRKDQSYFLYPLTLMREHNFRRLPVVDDKGRPIGIVTEHRLEMVKPPGGAPLLWQINYLIAHTSVGDVMRKDVVTVNPTDSVEHAIAKAQAAKVGTIIVIEKGRIVGICTTNDFFYGIVNPTLGIGEAGSRITIVGGGDSVPAEKILSLINKKGIKTSVIWAIYSHTIQKNNLVLHLDIEDASQVVEELKKAGYDAKISQR